MNFILNTKAKYRESFFSDSFLDQNLHISKNISVIAIVHLINTGIPYLKTLDKYFSLEFFIPKQKSIDSNLLKFFPKGKLLNLNRDEINTDNFLHRLDKIYHQIYHRFYYLFEKNINQYLIIQSYFPEGFIGIIEDTENGYQKYTHNNLKFPVISVARSLLKENEDHLVGQAVVFSTEAILREQ